MRRFLIICLFSLVPVLGEGASSTAPSRGASGPDADSLYPAPGQKDVMRIFPGPEVPDPLPHVADKVAGYPVTVIFPDGVPVKNFEVTIEDGAGKAVELYVSGPGKPANKAYADNQGNTICAIPKKPLAAKTRYTVKVRATAAGKPWSREWSFTTEAVEPYPGKRAEAALKRFNHFRKAAGLPAVSLDAERTKGCQAHAAYLSLHYRKRPIALNDEDPNLEGYTPHGKKWAGFSVPTFNAPDDPASGVDGLFDSVLNRALVLSPGLKVIGVGVVPQGRGNVWVINVQPGPYRVDGPLPVYPGDGQKDVPVDFIGDVSKGAPSAPRDAQLGFAISVGFPSRAIVKPDAEKTSLADADGKKVPVYLEKGRGGLTRVVLVPKKPLELGKTYTAVVSGTADGRPFRRKWTFHTMAEPFEEADVAKKLVGDLNAARKAVGLKPVALDPALSKGCKAHALYLQRNLNHPKVTGVGVHTEDRSLPGYTEEGKKVARGAVIAVLPGPSQAVKTWLATLYHRIPLLSPSLKRVGYAQARHADGYIQVLDIARGR